jgi:hypothetical protein
MFAPWTQEYNFVFQGHVVGGMEGFALHTSFFVRVGISQSDQWFWYTTA